MGWRELLSVRWDGGLAVRANWVILAAVITLSLVTLARLLVGRWHHYSTVEVNIPLAGQGSLTLKRTDEVVRIAHEAWTEIVTRKAGVPFDPDNDCIIEIYDSWYDLFRELRRLTRSVPGETLRRSQDARELVDILVGVLNTCLRPHLTTYQARFRAWVDRRRNEGDGLDPQEIERAYPLYGQLVADIASIHEQMMSFAGELHHLVHGPERARVFHRPRPPRAVAASR